MKPGVLSRIGMRILPLVLVMSVAACQKEKEKSLLEQYFEFLIQQYIINNIASASCTMLASNYADAVAPDDIPGDVPYTNTDQGIDEAYPATGPVVTKYMIINNRVQRVQLHDEGDKYVYGSDMLIPREQVFDYPDTAEGKYYSFATGTTSVRWHKNGSTGKFDVPYELDGGLPVAT
ncbi:MAG: hypothetical protein KDK33_03780, partial [Leptospiraceae bacterium]|nr:hypothetical protein [Leptospiraceae bacterium]